MSYITLSEYGRWTTLPISLPQTELRRQTYIQLCTFNLEIGQRLEMCCCHLHLFKILTPGVTPLLADSGLGLASVGLLTSTMASSAIGLVTLNAAGAASWNADQPVVITAPGIYRAVAFNNSTNVDLSVIVTGVVRIFY